MNFKNNKMKEVLVFAGSNSKQSINKQLATYASGLLEDVNQTILDLNDFNLPLYGIDIELSTGIPEAAVDFYKHITKANGIVLSLAEHNGAYAAVFKNLLDWMSRIEGKVFHDLPMLLMATSPGARGGLSVLEIAKDRFPRHGARVVASFSLPSFTQNFKAGKITDDALRLALNKEVEVFKSEL